METTTHHSTTEEKIIQASSQATMPYIVGISVLGVMFLATLAALIIVCVRQKNNYQRIK